MITGAGISHRCDRGLKLPKLQTARRREDNQGRDCCFETLKAKLGLFVQEVEKREMLQVLLMLKVYVPSSGAIDAWTSQ